MIETAPLKKILLRAPGAIVRVQQEVTTQWQSLNYLREPDLAAASAEHESLASIMRSAGAEIIYADNGNNLSLAAVYVRDAALPLPTGMLLARMGKGARHREPESLRRVFETNNIAIAGAIKAPGTLEGGDCLWIDAKTLLVGRTWRTNQSGIDQVAKILGDDYQVIGFDMPNYKGADDVFHLMSVLSPINARLVVGYLPLMPVALVEFLHALNMKILPVAETEFESMGCNILALGNVQVILLEGNPLITEALKKNGIIVHQIAGDHISHPGQGGPTCLTLPLVRG
jgi:N-dimethylarginine dimethylaminohydrolase